VQTEPFAAPRVCERFERDVEADLVPETKTVRNRPREAVNANGLVLDAVLLDAKIEHGSGNVNDPKRRRRNARHTRTTRNGNPDLGWKVRSDVMESEGRDQADYCLRDGSGGNCQLVVLSAARAAR